MQTLHNGSKYHQASHLNEPSQGCRSKPRRVFTLSRRLVKISPSNTGTSRRDHSGNLQPSQEEGPTSCHQAADGKGDAPEKEDDKPAVVPARWYERAYDYWEDSENCALDDNGVLGGYGHISPTDVSGSATFLDRIKSLRPKLGDGKAAGEACVTVAKRAEMSSTRVQMSRLKVRSVHVIGRHCTPSTFWEFLGAVG